MLINNSFAEIAEVLKAHDDILIFVHHNVDGDAVGSSVALCHALRKLGKNAYIIRDGEVPANLQFIDEFSYITDDQNVIENPELTVCVDANGGHRFPNASAKFNQGKVKVCIDHHIHESDSFADYNYVDPDSAAASELVYLVIKELGVEVDKTIAIAIFSGITTDTGNFQYSNTTKRSHEIVAELYSYGYDFAKASVEIYETVSTAKFKLQQAALSNSEFYCDGKLAITKVTQEMLKEYGAVMADSEGIVGTLRSLKEVEVSVLAKEISESEASFSIRSKNDIDVQKIAVKLGGGGHKKAAGARIYTDFDTAIEMAMKELVAAFEN